MNSEADTRATTAERSLVAAPPPLEAGSGNLGNRLMSGASGAAATLIVALLAAVGIFLLIRGWPAITTNSAELADSISWFPQDANLLTFIAPLVFGTVLAAGLALLLAVPMAIAIALYLSYYAPRRLAQLFGYLIDLLTAIPSVVYGLWGGLWLLPRLEGVWQWLSDVAGWLPFFAPPVATPARNIASVGVVLAIMVLPIITAIARESYSQTPRLHTEAALALGATRWEMLRMTVLPFGRSGVLSASMLGLGRALGETMAVLMILSPGASFSLNLLQAGQHQTIAANIAAQFPEANPSGVAVLITTGLALFVITLIVNSAARWITTGRKAAR